MATSDNHHIVADIAAVYCRENWQCWPVAIEPQGLTNRNYDVLAIKSSPQSIVGIEVKVSRPDFLAGMKKGHFEKTNYINELWLAYPGGFEINELPSHVGILKIRKTPVCKIHNDLKTICPSSCQNLKPLFLTEVRPAKYMQSDSKERMKYFSKYTPQWLWKIAQRNTTRIINEIMFNLIDDVSKLEERND